MLPLMDMINHKYGNSSNLSGLLFNDTHFNQFATRDIKLGEELFWNYSPDAGHRVDIMFSTYGYTMRQNPPLLCAIDLPDYEQQKIAGSYPPNDDGYYGPNGAYNSIEEYLRLQKLLKSMPTSIEDDEQILATIKAENWQDVEIIKFRLARKRALSRAMNEIII